MTAAPDRGAGAPEDGGADYAGLVLREAIARLGRVLAEAGIEDPARDARYLVLGALGLSGMDLLRAPERRLGDDEGRRISAIAQRRVAREPVSRILGERGFFGRTFAVTPATLDPRPCTETVIEAVLEIAQAEGWREAPLRILDIGTGTGALLLTLLAELPGAHGVGTDISDGALATAKANAVRLGLADRVEFLNRNGLDGVDGRFDVLVSNPPYIPSGDIAGLDPEVRDFDPRAALDGGADGLVFYRAFATGAKRVVPNGWVFVEVGAGQAEDVARLFSAGGGTEVRLWRDLGGHTRCVAMKTQNYP